KVINECPQVYEVKSAATHDIYPVHDFIAEAAAIVAAKYGDEISFFHPILSHFVDVNFRPSSEFMFRIPPVENQNSLTWSFDGCRFAECIDKIGNRPADES